MAKNGEEKEVGYMANRATRKRVGQMDSPYNAVRDDSDVELYYGDTEAPRDPLSYIPGKGKK